MSLDESNLNSSDPCYKQKRLIKITVEYGTQSLKTRLNTYLTKHNKQNMLVTFDNIC